MLADQRNIVVRGKERGKIERRFRVAADMRATSGWFAMSSINARLNVRPIMAAP
jgi:hypothetical protein